MSTLTLKIIYTLGVVVSFVIRIPYRQENRNNTIIDEYQAYMQRTKRLVPYFF